MGIFTRKINSSSPPDLPPRPSRRKESFTDPPNVFYPGAPSLPQYAYPPQRPTYFTEWAQPPNMTQPAMLMSQGTGSSQQTLSLPAKQIWAHEPPPPAYHYPDISRKEKMDKYEAIERDFDDVMTLIDEDIFQGDEDNLFTCGARRDHDSKDYCHSHQSRRAVQSADHVQERALFKPSKRTKSDEAKRKKKTTKKDNNAEQHSGMASVVAGTYFSKVELYANSRLPANLPPLSLYTATWPLLSLAAQHSVTVYENSSSASSIDNTTLVPPTISTKAMLIRSLPRDDLNIIILAIRGTSSFMDWAVNWATEPTSPEGFLDDPGNLCHKGFLNTARRMVDPVAKRLSELLKERSSRRRCSLLLTGHSAGGAVATLLFSHMLSSTEETRTALWGLTPHFKRIHCITFGAPPVSLLPLQKPPTLHGKSLVNYLFLSIINEGDPVPRAEKPYIKSILELLATPPPPPHTDRCRTRHDYYRSEHDAALLPIWPVPAATFSNAGRLIVLRSGKTRRHKVMMMGGGGGDRKTVGQRLEEGCVAVTCEDEELRGVVWGDPVAHLMRLYAGRVEMLAVDAAMGR